MKVLDHWFFPHALYYDCFFFVMYTSFYLFCFLVVAVLFVVCFHSCVILCVFGGVLFCNLTLLTILALSEYPTSKNHYL